MSRIYYTAGNYNGNYNHLNNANEQNLTCRKIDLIRAIVTVGNPSYISWKSIRENGLLRAISSSILEKVLLVNTYIHSDNNDLLLHPIFHNQISDIKRNVSYNLGMAVAKIYAEEIFDIPNLTHVESLKKRGAIQLFDGDGRSKEPDLVGMATNGQWHVFEAKGMSRNQINTKIRDAKEQGRQVDTIHGQNPETITACATLFRDDKIISRLEDPISDNKKEIKFNFEKYIEGYYNSFFSFKEYYNIEPQKDSYENNDFYSIKLKLEQNELSIGLDNEIYELLMQKDYNYIIEYYLRKDNNLKVLTFKEFDEFSIGKDGFIIRYKDK